MEIIIYNSQSNTPGLVLGVGVANAGILRGA